MAKATAPTAPKAPEPKIVTAVGSATSTKKTPLGKEIEKAMADAVNQAYKEGITDPVKIRARMMEAREKVKQEAAKGA
jgi:hypothetical protein